MSRRTDVRRAPWSATVQRAVAEFAAGNPVLVFDADDREAETDLIYPAGSVTTDDVARMRNDAGGLICVALADHVADAFDLPFLSEALDHPATDRRPEYDDRSSFSLTVNHRSTYTGITDEDRATTIVELATAAEAPSETQFAAEFRAPGHVHLLRAAPRLLAERRGHTELGTALALAAGKSPAVVVCEMLDDEDGGARSRTDAEQYANQHGFVFVEGSEIVNSLNGPQLWDGWG